MPAQDLRKLLERIHLRLDESFVGISSMVSDLAPADLAELFNQLTVPEAAAVVTMLPVQRTIEVFDQSTMRRRAAILEELEPARGAEILAGLSAAAQLTSSKRWVSTSATASYPARSRPNAHRAGRLVAVPRHGRGIMTTGLYISI